MKHANKTIMLILGILVLASGAVAQRDPAPRVHMQVPSPSANAATIVPQGYAFPVLARDEDSVGLLPRKYRYLLVEADAGGIEIATRYHYENYGQHLTDFHLAEWSGWYDYRLEDDRPPVIFQPDLDEDRYYLIAVQVLDAQGVPTLDREYGQQVINFRVSSTMFRPEIVISEFYLGQMGDQSSTEIASGQPLNFHLGADARHYGVHIATMRYGWDITDTNDPFDPNWEPATPFGVREIVVPERVFNAGLHSLTVRAEDALGFTNMVTCYLNVIPFVEPQNQLPLLFIDQVVDDNSNAWPDETGQLALDNAEYRDAYWEHLGRDNVVEGFDWDEDRLDHFQSVQYSDIVVYRSLLVTARANIQQTMFNQFRAENGVDKYVWLAPYQAQGGNLFLVGERSMESFMPLEPNYMTPMIFESEEDVFTYGPYTYIVGFGDRELPDGSTARRGPLMYPYLTAGISALDWASPVGKHVYGRISSGHMDRRSRCTGLKALVLNEEFRDNHEVPGWYMADTLYTNPLIDWRDWPAAAVDSLTADFPFRGDEFVDANITAAPTPVIAQECADGPGGMCVEPMFRGVARYDWLRERRWAEGYTDWPYDRYVENELREFCGEMALTAYDMGDDVLPLGTSRTNGHTYGFLSYKNVANKPSGKADVYWGFDPYRFDQTESRAAVRWVLDYFGLQLNP